MSDDTTKEDTNSPADDGGSGEPSPGESQHDSPQDGPTFTEAPDPLASVKKGASDVMDSMEGKTVSMKVYVGTILGIVVLMLLARCGG